MTTGGASTGKVRSTGLAFACVGLFFLVAGGWLFSTHSPVAGYGIWVFVWGLAFLVGALARNGEARA